MKNLKFVLLALFCLAVIPKGTAQVRSLSDVTVNEVETLYSDIITISGGYATLSVDILCTQDGGTTDGNIQLQSRNGSGGTWTYMGEWYSGDFLEINDADSIMTMTSAAVFRVVLTPAPFLEYRFAVVGTASDTTTVSFDYLINYRR